MTLHVVAFFADHPEYAAVEALGKCFRFMPKGTLSIVYDEFGTEYCMLTEDHSFNLFFTLTGYVGNVTLR